MNIWRIKWRSRRLTRLAAEFSKVCKQTNVELRELGMSRPEREKLFREISRDIAVSLPDLETRD